ncbi:MAG: hypothetical protein LBQ05_03335 [Christensenellaceae bacterium]|nr:hypothetical protein [Christensenellaceae bacterium]
MRTGEAGKTKTEKTCKTHGKACKKIAEIIKPYQRLKLAQEQKKTK